AIGPATDIYALGVILFELLAGRRPFQGPTLYALCDQILKVPAATPSTLCPGLDPRLDAICLRAMAKAPSDRFSSMAELAAALVEYYRATEDAAGLPAGPAVAGQGDSPEAF